MSLLGIRRMFKNEMGTTYAQGRNSHTRWND